MKSHTVPKIDICCSAFQSSTGGIVTPEWEERETIYVYTKVNNKIYYFLTHHT